MMSPGRDSKSFKTTSDEIMRAALTEGQTHILPDKEGIKKITAIRAALSSYYLITNPKIQMMPSSAIDTFTPNEKNNALQNISTTTDSKIESPVNSLSRNKKKSAIKPLRPIPSYLDHRILNRIDHKTKKIIVKKYQDATFKNQQLKFFKKLPNVVFGLICDNLDAKSLNVVNRTCIESNRLFQNQMRDKLEEKKFLLQKLLQYVADADYDHAEEFIKWHYRFQLVTPQEKMPIIAEQDMIYVEQKGNVLEYTLTTSDGQCVKNRTITLADLNEIKKFISSDKKIEISTNFTKKNLNSLRPFILAITNKNKYTQLKNNRCLLIMEGEVGCDLYLMADEKVIQESDFNHLRLYRKNNGIVYHINGEEYAFENTELNIEITKLFEKLTLNRNGVLTNNKLSAQQRKFCKQLLAETAIRRHTSYVYSGHRIKGTALAIALGAEDVSRETHPDEGIAEMIISELKKLRNGNMYIKSQIQKQFPEGWEAKENSRHEQDVKALHKVRNAIAGSLSNRDPKLIAAIHEFKEYLEPKGVIETGRHWNARLLQEALEMGFDKDCYEARKDNLFYNQVVGSIETHAPTNYAMAQAQGLNYLLDPHSSPEKFNRSLKYRLQPGYYYPLSSIPQFCLGIDAWVECYYGQRCFFFSEGAWPGHGTPHNYRWWGASALQELISSKKNRIEEIKQQFGHQPKTSDCLVM